MSENNNDLNSLVGRTLGQFRIVERIGAGGMAMVFKAYQQTLDRYVAIKVLPAYHARDPIFVKRFEQEARSVAKLAHPHIVQIHDFGEEDHITYIVMEYVDGGTLKDRLKRPLPPAEAADFIIQAAEGLDCAHRNGIVHRDVKPANMLLRRDGHLLLSDFGIAKILEGTTNLTRAGTGIGTPQYMSPEQGVGQKVDRRSDIYSLGIVFFHCLTGHVPFTGDNPLTITMKHLNEPLPIDHLRMAGVPGPIIQVIQRMTAKAAQDRYQTTDALIEALANALAASNIMSPRLWRGASFIAAQPSAPADVRGVPSGQLAGAGAAGASPASHSGLANSPAWKGVPSPSAPLPVSPVTPDQPQTPSIVCFRCGTPNPGTGIYCTACGYDLSNKQASEDTYLGPNGRPVLALLSFQNGPLAGRSYRFHQVVTTIGRTNGNNLVIGGQTVSRRHARLWFSNGRWFLEDLGSSNGTLVNNQRIYKAVALNDGDVINFGDEVVVFDIIYGS
ncbi:MAG: protein kinase [Ktedonobacteraceae bacterium]|nr:protein kinase [Ktedonobacteraceae bacterium]